MSKSSDKPWLRPIARRTVLKGMAVGGGALLVGRAAAINEILPAYGTEQLLSTADSEGLLQVVVKNGIILRVQSLDYPDNIASPMGLAWAHRQYAPDRILYPMVRADWAPGGKSDTTTRGKPNYKRVPWDQALDLVAGELKRVKGSYGNEAILGQVIAGWQTAGNFNTKNGQAGRFFGLYGGSSRLLGNKSYACWQWAAPYSYGTTFPQDSMADTLQNSKAFIFWASNPLNLFKVRASSYKRVREWIWQMKQRGIRVIVIDPVFTETAALADEWVPMRPGGDGALMAAMAYVMINGGHHDQAFIDKYVVGFEPFRKYIMGESDNQPKTPEWAADKTDISAAKIRELATYYATTKGVKIGSARGIQRQDHGEQNVRLLIALATIKGEFGLPGGGLSFDLPGFDGIGAPKVKGKGPAGFPGVENPVTQTILEQQFANSLLNAPVKVNHDGTTYPYPEPGKFELKLIHWVGGSGLNQHDHIDLTLQALQKIETMIVQDSWWTPAARMADIVLPINTLFERNDMTQFYNYVIYQHQIVEPLGESRSDFQVFSDLADRLGFKDKFTLGRDTDDAWLRFLYSSADLGMSYDDFKQKGYVRLPVDDTPYVAFSEFRQNPALNPLGTPSGKLEIYSAKIDSYHYDDCPPTPQWMEPTEWLGSAKTATYPLHLLTTHPIWRRHSSYDDVDTLRKDSKIGGFEPVLIHPADAEARGIATGDIVRVFNDRGQAVCAANVTEDIRPKVVVLHEGSWYRPVEPGTIGSLDRGGCANMLTRQVGTSQLAQGPVVGSNLVQIEKVQGTIQPNDYAPIQSS